MIGLVKEPEIAMAACQADLEFCSAPIGSDEIEFIAASEISGSLSPFDQVQIQEKRNLDAGQACTIDITDATQQIKPLVRPAYAGTHPKPETGRNGRATWKETVETGIDSHTENLVVLPHQQEWQQKCRKQNKHPFHRK